MSAPSVRASFFWRRVLRYQRRGGDLWPWWACGAAALAAQGVPEEHAFWLAGKGYHDVGDLAAATDGQLAARGIGARRAATLRRIVAAAYGPRPLPAWLAEE